MSQVNKYDKKTPREHVLLRPDTYIGDIEKTKEEMWIWNEKKEMMKKYGRFPKKDEWWGPEENYDEWKEKWIAENPSTCDE